MQTSLDATSSLQVSTASNSQLAGWFEYAETMLDIKSVEPDKLYFYIDNLKKLALNLLLRDLYSMIDLAAYGHLNIELKEIRSLAPVRLAKLIHAYRLSLKSRYTQKEEERHYTPEEERQIFQKFRTNLMSGFQKYKTTGQMPYIFGSFIYKFYVKEGLIQPNTEVNVEIGTKTEQKNDGTIGSIIRTSWQNTGEFRKIKFFYDDLIKDGKELELCKLPLP